MWKIPKSRKNPDAGESRSHRHYLLYFLERQSGSSTFIIISY